MEETKFRLLFKGDVASGSDIDEVKRKLSLLFKSDIAKIETLFSGKTKILKDNLAENEALKLKKAFDNTGGIAVVEPVPGQGAADAGGNDRNRPVYPGNEAPAVKNVSSATGNPEQAMPGAGDGVAIRQDPGGVRPITVKTVQITCPKCDTRQDKNDSCINCGIIYEKFKPDLEREMAGYGHSNMEAAAQRQFVEDVHAIAAAQQLLIWAVVAFFAIAVSPLLYFVVVPFELYAVYRISRVLRLHIALSVVCVFCMFLPLICVIVLLILNSKATRALASAGVSVGLFGASQAELDALGPRGKGSSLFAPVFVTLLLALAVAGISTGLLPSVTSGRNWHFGNSIEREIAAANRKLPMQIDAETRLDSIVAGPDKVITYNYTLINHAAGDLDGGKMGEALGGRIRHDTCADKEMKGYIKDGYSIVFSYKGNDGNPVTAVTVAPQDCGS